MFWKIFSELCKTKGTTPSAVAVKIGLSNSITTKWKNGAIPNGEILLKLSNYFDCSIDYLLKGIEQNQFNKLSDDKKYLINIYDQLTDIDKGRILDRIESYLERYNANDGDIDREISEEIAQSKEIIGALAENATDVK